MTINSFGIAVIAITLASSFCGCNSDTAESPSAPPSSSSNPEADGEIENEDVREIE